MHDEQRPVAQLQVLPDGPHRFSRGRRCRSLAWLGHASLTLPCRAKKLPAAVFVVTTGPKPMAERRCAFLTMPDPGDYVTDYDLAIRPLAARGWRVDELPWRTPGVDWARFDAVYICTPWDYPAHIGEFLDVLRAIDASRAVLVNDFELVRWSLEKTYLRDLESQGAAVVPSLWCDDIATADMDAWFRRLGSDTLVIKPVVGANARDTLVLRKPLAGDLRQHLLQTFAARPCFVQPFMENILDDGEYSLFFLGGEYSHAIRKLPKAGDFRVQEEHGADIRPVEAAEDLVSAAAGILALVTPMPVYARVDFVRGTQGSPLLMELEIIEPSLYLRTDELAPGRFAAAFDGYVRSREFAREGGHA